MSDKPYIASIEFPDWYPDKYAIFRDKKDYVWYVYHGLAFCAGFKTHAQAIAYVELKLKA